jgi:hypothetical protein
MIFYFINTVICLVRSRLVVVASGWLGAAAPTTRF